jgi:hypothetical protein
VWIRLLHQRSKMVRMITQPVRRIDHSGPDTVTDVQIVAASQ